jgi:uncharacterized protein YutE (UPF0331/DUF86 family)
MDEETERRILDRATYVGEALKLLVDQRDSLSFADYRASRRDRDIVEREFETAIEACIDIGQLLLQADDAPVPETNAGVFHRLGERALVSESTAERMATAAGFRNVLSHQYGADIDDRDVYNFLQTELPLFRSFLHEVRARLEE